MKFPSASAGGTVPSGSSVFVTNPGVLGSRVGGAGRGGGGAGCGAAWAAAAAAAGRPPPGTTKASQAEGDCKGETAVHD